MHKHGHGGHGAKASSSKSHPAAHGSSHRAVNGDGPTAHPALERVNSDTIRAAIPLDTLPYALPPGPETSGSHCWSQLDGRSFSVRGPCYLADKKKVTAGASAFDLMNVDIYLSHDKMGNVAARSGSYLRRAREEGDARYYLVVLYVTPSAPYIHLSFYFAVDPARVAALPHFAKLWEEFTADGEEADTFRNERWKVIPRVAEGAWIVQKAVGQKPALLAQKLAHTWVLCHGTGGADGEGSAASSPAGGAGAGGGTGATPPRPASRGVATTSSGCDANLAGARARGGSIVSHSGPGPYLEADCDVASSSMAFMLVSLLQNYAKHIVIDLGFAIEPRSENEMPEVILGAVRLSRVDVNVPRVISAEPGDMVLGALGVTHGSGGAAAAAAAAAARPACLHPEVEDDGEEDGSEHDETVNG